MRKLWQSGVVWLGLLTAVGSAGGQGRSALEHLRCDGEESPLAIAEPHPLFTWTYPTTASAGAIETASHVVVESTSGAGKRTVWDSGWIESSDMGARYAGSVLQPGTTYTWRVDTHNRDGSEAHSGKVQFRMADSTWTAQWIAAPWSTERDGSEADGSKPLPIFRREFALKAKPVEATLRIVGLGQWQASIGHAGKVQPVLPSGLHGAWTDYRKTIAYDAVDVTTMLGVGKNVLSVLLGNGMYNVQRSPFTEQPKKERYIKFAGSFGVPKLITELHLRYADGSSQTIMTDSQWRVARGPVVFDSTYGGEDFDARLENTAWYMPGFDDRSWSTVRVVDGPGGKLVPAIAPAVGQHESYLPVKQTDIGGGRTVFDLGQNFAGVVRVRMQGSAGAILRLTPGELLNKDGSVSQVTFHGPMWWSYRLRGDKSGESWEPLFGYSGFRYVQAEWTPGPGMAASKDTPSAGKLLSLTGAAEYSDSTETGSFASSSEMLNRIHALIVHAMHSNEVSLFTDCPHREKLGWLEQTHLVAPGLMFNNDVERMYRATDKNMADAQLPDGIVPTIAPQYTKFGPQYPVYDDSPEWGSASVLAPWWAYSFYGDKAELERAWPTMQAYVAALEAKATDGIVAYGLGDWYDIGPGGPGMEKNTSLGVTGTLMLLQDAQAMQKIALLLGRSEDAAKYQELARKTIAAFNLKFWNQERGWYDTGSQTAQAMPLVLGVVPEDRRARVLAHLLDDIKVHDNHATAGEVGYPYLLRALGTAGRDDLVLAMLLRKDAPSYGSQIEAGATTLTEAWDANPHASQNHFMLGGAEEWLYRRLGGVDIDMSREQSAERITVRPIALAGVDWAKVGFDAKAGHVQSDWMRRGNNVDYRITVPGGIEATIVLPETAVAANRELKAVAHESTQTKFRVGPGVWEFHAHE